MHVKMRLIPTPSFDGGRRGRVDSPRKCVGGWLVGGG